ncbi:DUF433 domain-containing protein [Daejeonella sp.]|uniref:DUF433 domain-containing protein n=1 Tax=Daejeonella sp. TaxID=2805397 RepID=UPI003983C7C5
MDANVCNGKPIIKGKRISVQTIMEFLSAGETSEDTLKQYPSLETEDTACMRYATELMNHSFIIKHAAVV